MSNENPNFRLKPVAEFLDGNHNFFIPSYQRGYRWDKKQVEDLLKDIWDFAKKPDSDFYCLQPVVVKEKKWEKDGVWHDGWEVIDGQQRLTTLWLLLTYIKKDSRTPFVTKSCLYNLNYETRKELNLDNPDKNQNIDEFYVFCAKENIKKWFEDRIAEDEIDYSAFEKVLFNRSKEVCQVKFIWYVVENKNDLNSIKVFNNLNKGKIRLTNAELIKALFILKASKKNDSTNELMLEWDMMENALHDDKFWLFLTNKNYNPATRIDLIFDFLANKATKDDDDFSYRKFQNLYDGVEKQFWNDMEVETFTDAWTKVKSVFQMFMFWYENNSLYHYIGYLLAIGVSHKDIYEKVSGRPKTSMIEEVKILIKDKLNFTADKIREIEYNQRDIVRKVLLLFNIESCIKSNVYRFPFDLYKNESWDIEHIASQTENNLTKISDKITWLKFVEAIECNNPEWSKLKDKALELCRKLKLEETKGDIGNMFDEVYKDIIEMVEPENNNSINSENKNLIGNLTLLDERTNREYGNALFQTKRRKIIEKDVDGTFVPPCTKNIFLKYYASDNDSSMFKNSWTQQDADSYIDKIVKTINDFLK